MKKFHDYKAFDDRTYHWYEFEDLSATVFVKTGRKEDASKERKTLQIKLCVMWLLYQFNAVWMFTWS